MADVTIRETTVLPDGDGLAVRIEIADGPPPYETASTHLRLSVRLPAYEPPLLAHLQAETVRAAIRQLQAIETEVLREIGRARHHHAEPQPRGSQP
jgi:hypothetical protein